MKKKKTKHSKLWAIGAMAIFLLVAAPSAWAQYVFVFVDCDGDQHLVNGEDIECGEGSTHLIDTPIDGLNVWADTTVNLYVSVPYVYVSTGGILNIYAGSIDGLYIGTVILTDDTDAIVTVYGTDFQADWNRDGTIVSLEGATEFMPNSNNPNDTYGSVLIATDENGNPMNLLCFSNTTPINLVDIKNDENVELIIDIKPGSDENVINLKSRGVVPVAVLATSNVELDTLDLGTVEFAGAKPVRTTLCDVDGVGGLDILFHFRTQQLDLNEDSESATLTAMKGVSMLSSTTAGDALEGTDKVKIKSSKKKHRSLGRYTSKHNRPRRGRKGR